MQPRPQINSFSEFCKIHQEGHRNPYNRGLHFAGTTILYGGVGYVALNAPVTLLMTLPIIAVLGAIGFRMERTRSAGIVMLAILVVVGVLLPWYMIATVLLAYALAWIGHFIFEANRPASIAYPLWAVIGEFKAWGGAVVWLARRVLFLRGAGN
jgi:hypothetical protein